MNETNVSVTLTMRHVCFAGILDDDPERRQYIRVMFFVMGHICFIHAGPHALQCALPRWADAINMIS